MTQQINFKCSSTKSNPYKIDILLDKYIDLSNDKRAFIQLNTIYFPNNFVNNYGFQYFTCYYKKGTIDEVKRMIPIPLSMYSLETALKTILECCSEAFADKPEKFNINYGITDTKEGFSYFYIDPNIDATHSDYLLEFSGDNTIGLKIGYANYTMPPYSGEFPITKILKHYQNIPCQQEFITCPILVKISTNINVSTNINNTILSLQKPVENQNIVYMFNAMTSDPFTMTEKVILTDVKIEITDVSIKDVSIEFIDSQFKSLRPLDDSALSSIDYTIFVD